MPSEAQVSQDKSEKLTKNNTERVLFSILETNRQTNENNDNNERQQKEKRKKEKWFTRVLWFGFYECIL